MEPLIEMPTEADMCFTITASGAETHAIRHVRKTLIAVDDLSYDNSNRA